MSRTDRKEMCNICKVITLKSNLRRHMRTKHDILSSNPSKTPEPSGDQHVDVICKYCKKIFRRRKALLQHYRTVHANDPGVLSECAWVETYACHLCRYRTTRKNALSCHLKNIHVNRPSEGTPNLRKCPMCHQFESTRDRMIKHYQSAHDVRLVLENFKFNSEPLFNEWKSKIEEDNSCKFTRTDCYQCADSRTKVVYRCQRDGIYKSKGKNTRRPKSSSKMNAICPATLKVEIGPDGVTSVSYCKTHFGHSGEAVKSCLSRVERGEIARKISEGLSFDQIMDSFRSNKVRLKRKDLHNIVRDYNLQKEASGYDYASVELWIQDLLVLNNVIRFYKPRGEVLTSYPNLGADSLILVIMNDAQVDMARRNGANVICACVVLSSEISTMTISILDDHGRGVPVAFLFSNSISVHIIDVFVICFKEAIGFKLKPRMLITDVDGMFSSAWNKHMIEAESRLYCGYCVEQSWGKYLERINDRENQVDIRTALNLMKCEPNKAVFSTKANNALNNWNNRPDTKQFASHFEEIYLRWPSRWASSCNASLDLVQPPFVALHEKISQIYLGANARPNELDVTVHALMEHLRNVLLEGLVHLSKHEASMRLHSIKSRHDAATVIAADRIECLNNLWKVPAADGCKFHEVKSTKTECHCEVKCDECKACIHSYTCSCADSTFKFNFCKHIHAVCQHVLRTSGTDRLGNKDNFRFVNSGELPDVSEHAMSNGDEPVTDMEREKQRLVTEFTAIINRVSSIGHVKFIDKSLELLKTLPSSNQHFSYLNEKDTSKFVYMPVPSTSTRNENNSKNPPETLKLAFRNGKQLPHRTLEGVEGCILTYAQPR